MGRTRRNSSEALHNEARQHIAAVRAFHTGLVAESHKHLHVLATFTRHVDVLREERRHVREKLASVEACCRELANLRRLRQPWRETYEDLRHSLLRARALFRRIVKASSGNERAPRRARAAQGYPDPSGKAEAADRTRP
jgi:hypothetical protein